MYRWVSWEGGVPILWWRSTLWKGWTSLDNWLLFLSKLLISACFHGPVTGGSQIKQWTPGTDREAGILVIGDYMECVQRSQILVVLAKLCRCRPCCCASCQMVQEDLISIGLGTGLIRNPRRGICLSTLSPSQNGRHFAEDISKCNTHLHTQITYISRCSN